MQLRERDARAPRLGEKLSHEGDGLLRPFSRPPSRGQLSHEGAGAVANLHEPLCLEIAICLRDSRRIDSELGRQLADRWQGRCAAERARRDCQAHALGDLDVKRNGTAGIDIVKHRGQLAFQCTGTV